MYLSCVAVCANGRDVVFPRRDVRKCIRSLNGSVCREDDVLIDAVQIVPIHVCQLFGCYNVRFSVRNDQNAACSRTGYTPLHWGNSEMSLLSARRGIIFTFFFFFFFFFFAPHTRRLIGGNP